MFGITQFLALVRRKTKRTGEAETDPNSRRTNSLHHGCFYSDRMMRQTRAEFRPQKRSRHRGFESPSLRHGVCAVQRDSPELDPVFLLSPEDGESVSIISSHDVVRILKPIETCIVWPPWVCILCARRRCGSNGRRPRRY